MKGGNRRASSPAVTNSSCDADARSITGNALSRGNCDASSGIVWVLDGPDFRFERLSMQLRAFVTRLQQERGELQPWKNKRPQRCFQRCGPEKRPLHC
jgi:hypothetical protein